MTILSIGPKPEPAMIMCRALTSAVVDLRLKLNLDATVAVIELRLTHKCC